ncbi:hypothetical protein POVWA2_044640 [Plasmodium ovale wallikeri]|uniref:Uncharacterized protein n=1 Tax=Plasmodium ovale wallikeri TaxID=864142 RepID=A0A1A8ZG33_PLAOA|nr:hypothetical protein POVWA1_046100 [Plasmodium ovale wallikeri]SBT42798.1 hypothetical protein POVWA2_044640 [Plasmodium ovale wallikeri]
MRDTFPEEVHTKREPQGARLQNTNGSDTDRRSDRRVGGGEMPHAEKMSLSPPPPLQIVKNKVTLVELHVRAKIFKVYPPHVW